MLYNSQAKPQALYNMSMLTALQSQIYFYGKVLMSREIEKKKLNIVHNAVKGTLAGMAVHLVEMT